MEQGESGKDFFILYEGAVSIIVDGKEKTVLSASTDKLQIFGEQALLKHDVRSATVKVQTDTARTLSMDKASFDMVLGPLDKLMERPADAKSAVEVKKEAEAKG